VQDTHGSADELGVMGHGGADGEGLTPWSQVGHDAHMVSGGISLAERRAKWFGEADLSAQGCRHMALVWDRTFSGASDRSSIPATFRALKQRTRDSFSVAVVRTRSPEACVRQSPRDQDRAVDDVLRDTGVGLTDERRPELGAAGRVLTILERYARHRRACKGEGRRVGTHRSDPDVVHALEPFEGGLTHDLG
jgi:hypothetical protein